jgi:hypothetical protein
MVRGPMADKKFGWVLLTEQEFLERTTPPSGRY